MITAIYCYSVFQRGLYVLHELCKKVLQTLRLRPATVYVQLQMALSLHPRRRLKERKIVDVIL